MLLLLLLTTASLCTAQNLDIQLLRDAHENRYKQYDGLMEGATNSVYPICIAVPIAQLAYEFAKHDTTAIYNGWTTIAALGINTILTTGLKYTINRPRPYKTYSDIHPYAYDSDPSFPSGHTSYAFSLATSLTLEYKKWYVAVPAYAWAATAGYSRLYLGEHYPSDVLAGAIVGVGSAWLSYKGGHWLLYHRNKKIQEAKIVH